MDVGLWHFSDQSAQSEDVRSSGAERTLRDCLSTTEFDPQLTSTHWNGSRGFRNAPPEPISALGQPFVGRNGPLEVVVFLAGNEAEIFQCRQVLLGLGGLAKHQIGLAEMLMRTAVAGI